jgi:peroxiredoxin
VAQLCQNIDEFQAHNTKVIIITFGTLPAAKVWLKETCSPFHLLLDTEREVYRSYGLERSLLRSWGLKTLWHYMRLLASGRRWHGIQGDSTQLGGDFIVDVDGVIRLVYPSHDPTDRPSVDNLMVVLRQLNK